MTSLWVKYWFGLTFFGLCALVIMYPLLAPRKKLLFYGSPAYRAHRARELEAWRADPGEITWLDDGFRIPSASGDPVAVAWGDLRAVFAYKRDLYTTDEICLDVFFPDDSSFTITEGTAGWPLFVQALEAHLSIFPGWFADVSVPALKIKLTLLYEHEHRSFTEAVTVYYPAGISARLLAAALPSVTPLLMAWNKYYVFVKAPASSDMDALLVSLGLGQYQPVEDVPLHASNKPNTLFAGFYQGNLLLVHPDLAFHFFGEGASDTERLFVQTFPGKEIAALIENSTVGLFGYAVIENGRKIRMKDGCDGEIYNDRGELLPEEQEILAEEIFGEDELEEMREDGLSEAEIASTVSFEASWRVPNLLSARYLGVPVGAIDTEQVRLTRYE